MRNLHPSQARKENHQNPSPADYHSLRIGTSRYLWPFATKSRGGAVHFVVFTDDYTRYIFVYFLLDKKSETCVSAFQLLQHKFDAWSYDIKRFRYDNGRGEYDNRFFRSILAARGINFEPFPPYTQHKMVSPRG